MQNHHFELIRQQSLLVERLLHDHRTVNYLKSKSISTNIDLGFDDQENVYDDQDENVDPIPRQEISSNQ